MHILSPSAAYHTEKVHPVRESRAPSYSFGLKPELPSRRVHAANPSPSAYTLPSLTGSNIVSKRSNPSFSMTGRSKIGSFQEDTRKVSDKWFTESDVRVKSVVW